MSEATEQQKVIEWCDWNRVPVYHVPNGGHRSAKEAYFLKLSGVKPGVPDLCIPEPRGHYHGLYIELKVGKNKLSENQRHWIYELNKRGYKAAVCYGASAAVAEIKSYLALE